MSKILVDTIDTRSGTSTLTLGSSNAGTIALGSGDVQSNFLYPAFKAYPNSTQTPSVNTWTKAALDTEVFDTDSCYDTSNYRFTPTKAGKYFFTFQHTDNYSSSAASHAQLRIYKNGSSVAWFENAAKGTQYGSVTLSTTLEMNGSSDYVEFYIEYEGGSGVSFRGGVDRAFATGYRIGT